jgi:hypothetical protein
MPLNREFGEEIEGMPADFVVSDISEWQQYDQLIKDAAKHAADVYVEAGAIMPVVFSADDILVQEYHSTGQVAFLFQRVVNGIEMFVPYVYDLPDDFIAELRTVGRWRTTYHADKKR